MRNYGVRKDLEIFCTVCSWSGKFEEIKTNKCPSCGTTINISQFLFVTLGQEIGFVQGGQIILMEDESIGGSIDFKVIKRLTDGKTKG